jgi:FkbM family methyltransferase
LSPGGWQKLLANMLVALHLNGFFIIRRNGYKLHFFPTALSVTLFLNKNAWRYEEIFLEYYLRDNDVVLDIGANIGNIGIRAATLFDNCRVYLIEPHPKIFEYLGDNIRLNKLNNAFPINCALGSDNDGSVYFSDGISDDLNAVKFDSENAINVEIRTLDSLFIEPKIDFIKVDVEGFELEVFKGGVKLLSVTNCVMFESWDKHFKKYGTNSFEVMSFLRNLGFEIYKWDDSKLIKLNNFHISELCENLLAIRDIVEFTFRFQEKN